MTNGLGAFGALGVEIPLVGVFTGVCCREDIPTTPGGLVDVDAGVEGADDSVFESEKSDKRSGVIGMRPGESEYVDVPGEGNGGEPMSERSDPSSRLCLYLSIPLSNPPENRSRVVLDVAFLRCLACSRRVGLLSTDTGVGKFVFVVLIPVVGLSSLSIPVRRRDNSDKLGDSFFTVGVIWSIRSDTGLVSRLLMPRR